jgi:hypothetical protein
MTTLHNVLVRSRTLQSALALAYRIKLKPAIRGRLASMSKVFIRCNDVP